MLWSRLHWFSGISERGWFSKIFDFLHPHIRIWSHFIIVFYGRKPFLEGAPVTCHSEKCPALENLKLLELFSCLPHEYYEFELWCETLMCQMWHKSCSLYTCVFLSFSFHMCFHSCGNTIITEFAAWSTSEISQGALEYYSGRLFWINSLQFITTQEVNQSLSIPFSQPAEFVAFTLVHTSLKPLPGTLFSLSKHLNKGICCQPVILHSWNSLVIWQKIRTTISY